MFVSKTITDLKDTGTRLAQHACSFLGVAVCTPIDHQIYTLAPRHQLARRHCCHPAGPAS
jgi:hypothetical protein